VQRERPASAAVNGNFVRLNNVFSVSAAGERKALCGCGTEFVVSESSPVISSGRLTMYRCSADCMEQAMRRSASAFDEEVASWLKTYKTLEMSTNVFEDNGLPAVDCGCGHRHGVSEVGPTLWEDGRKFYCCSSGCLMKLVEGPAGTGRANG
jgi:hypothetical protein